MAGLHTNRGRKRAREAREALRLDPGVPLECLLRSSRSERRLRRSWRRCPTRSPAPASQGGAVLWVNGNQIAAAGSGSRSRTSSGTSGCGHDGGARGRHGRRRSSGKTTNPLEIEANAFAAEFLVPARRAGGPRRTASRRSRTWSRSRSRYGVSAIVLVYRLTAEARARARARRAARAGDRRGAARAGLRAPRAEPLEDRLATVESSRTCRRARRHAARRGVDRRARRSTAARRAAIGPAAALGVRAAGEEAVELVHRRGRRRHRRPAEHLDVVGDRSSAGGVGAEERARRRRPGAGRARRRTPRLGALAR